MTDDPINAALQLRQARLLAAQKEIDPADEGGKTVRLVDSSTGKVVAVMEGVSDGAEPGEGQHFDEASSAGPGEKA